MKSPEKDNRIFGFMFGAIFLLIVLHSFFSKPFGPVFCITLFCSLFFFSSAIFKPSILSPLKKIWVQFGETISRVTNPLILGIIYFFLITPFALVGRLFGRDPLRLKKIASVSYWVHRQPSEISPKSFENQY